MIETVRKYADELIPLIQTIQPQASGIMPSEMLLFCALCWEQNVRTVVESGRKNGYSTEVLAACMPNVVSIESTPVREADSRLRDRENLALVTGDGRKLVPHYIAGRTAVLLDGPKGMGAYQLFDGIRDNVVFAAIHDMTAANEARAQIREGWYSDDAAWTAEFGYLDEFWVTNGGYSSRAEMTRDSFGFGIYRGGQWE